MIKGGEGWDDYVDRIGLFFFFVACAGISLIVWIFNWVCWLIIVVVVIFFIIQLIKELHGG